MSFDDLKDTALCVLALLLSPLVMLIFVIVGAWELTRSPRIKT